jgi:hypothetical protein
MSWFEQPVIIFLNSDAKNLLDERSPIERSEDQLNVISTFLKSLQDGSLWSRLSTSALYRLCSTSVTLHTYKAGRPGQRNLQSQSTSNSIPPCRLTNSQHGFLTVFSPCQFDWLIHVAIHSSVCSVVAWRRLRHLFGHHLGISRLVHFIECRRESMSGHIRAKAKRWYA